MKDFLRKIILTALIVFVGYMSSAYADTSDTAKYLQLVNITKDAPPEQQLKAFRQFLQDNPDLEPELKNEVTQNIQTLQKYVNESDPQKKKEKKDADSYMKALKFSQTLTLEDQENLWDQFLSEHPKSYYAPEATSKLQDLRKRLGLNPDGTRIKKVVEKDITDAPLTSRLNYKNPDTGLLLSSLVGLVVPGMGHWYTHDYLIAGILTAIRIAGGISFVNGYVTETSSYYILGGILAGASYFGDVADATFSVDRYNDALEKKQGIAFNLAHPLTLHF